MRVMFIHTKCNIVLKSYRDIPEAIHISSEWAGMEKVLQALLPNIIRKYGGMTMINIILMNCNSLGEVKRFTFLNSFLNEVATPETIIRCICQSLLGSVFRKEEEHVDECIELLSVIHQRDTRILQEIIKGEYTSQPEGQLAIDQLLLKLSLVSFQ